MIAIARPASAGSDATTATRVAVPELIALRKIGTNAIRTASEASNSVET